MLVWLCSNGEIKGISVFKNGKYIIKKSKKIKAPIVRAFINY
jgi:hypothetical protein